MSNGERETPTNSPLEGERKQERKRTPEDQERKERERKKEAKKEKKERKGVEKEAKISPEEKAAKELEKLAVSAERLVKGFDELYERTGDLSLAFSQLSTQIEEGTIKDFEQLSKVMDWFEGKLKTAGNRIDRTAKKAEKAAEDSRIAAEAQKENAEAVKQFVSEYEAITKGFRETAEAFVEQGMAGVPPTARPPRYEKGKEEDLEGWFEEQLRRVEERDQSFNENWRMIWPMETFLSSIPTDEPEAKAFYQKLAKKFEDRRRLHDYQWLYGRSAGTEPILNASSILSTGAIERVIGQEGVTEAMKKFEKLAEDIYDARKEEREDDQRELKKKMGKLIRGEIDIDEEGNEITLPADASDKERKDFEDKLAQNRLGGRLFVVLGFTASYDIDDFAAGDFFTARLMHLKRWFVGTAKKEGDRWFGREKLWQRFSPDLWGTNYVGGLLANIRGFSEKEGMLEKYGLRLEKTAKEPDGRRRQVIKMDNPEKLKQLDLKGEGVGKESILVDWADSVWKADQVRKLLIGVNGYLDRPIMENFLKLGDALDHIKGEKRWGFFSLMFHDLADFHTGPGLFERIKEGKFWETFNVRDPESGKIVSSGISFIRSDAERLGLDRGWSLGEVHKNVEQAQRANMFLKPYSERVLREKIRLFGLPGIGPARFTREMLDYIGWGGLLGMIFAPIIEFFRQLRKQMEAR